MPFPHSLKTLQAINLGNFSTPDEMKKIKLYETIRDFNYSFEFGKSYLLDGKLGRGNWAISWLIGGLVTSLSDSKILIDGQIVSKDVLRRIAWCVSWDGYEKLWGFPKRYKSIKRQIRDGLTQTNHTSEAELFERFLLSPERYTRPLTQLSSEKWRASVAIGFAKGRSIYCFPNLDYVHTSFLIDYGNLWFRDMISSLTDNGALVLIPAQYDQESENICDVVVPKSLIDRYYKK